LLAYNEVSLSEGPWAAGANRDAYETGRFLGLRPNPGAGTMPRPLTSGPFDPSLPQDTTPMSGFEQTEMLETNEDGEIPAPSEPVIGIPEPVEATTDTPI
jgi:hypothetical protein